MAVILKTPSYWPFFCHTISVFYERVFRGVIVNIRWVPVLVKEKKWIKIRLDELLQAKEKPHVELFSIKLIVGLKFWKSDGDDQWNSKSVFFNKFRKSTHGLNLYCTLLGHVEYFKRSSWGIWKVKSCLFINEL